MRLLFTIPLLIFSIVISPTSTVRSLILQVWAEITDLEENRMDRTVSKIKEEELPQHPRLLFSQEGIEKLKERIGSYDWAEARWNRVKESADGLIVITITERISTSLFMTRFWA